jgi:hypothetical protein
LDVSVVPDPPNEVVITVGIETATNLNWLNSYYEITEAYEREYMVSSDFNGFLQHFTD